MNGPELPEGALLLAPRELRNGDRITGTVVTVAGLPEIHTTFASCGAADLVVLRDAGEIPKGCSVVTMVMKEMRGDSPSIGDVEWAFRLDTDERYVVLRRGGPRIIGEFPHHCPRCSQPAYVGSFEVTHAHPYHQIACPARKG